MRASGRDWSEKQTELIRGQNTRRKTADPSDRQLNLFHQQTYVIQTIRRDSRREIRRLLQITWNSILNFQVQFQLAPFIIFFNDCYEVVIISLQYPISYTL